MFEGVVDEVFLKIHCGLSIITLHISKNSFKNVYTCESETIPKKYVAKTTTLH